MAWYWIILIVIGYIVIATLTAIFCYRVMDDDIDVAALEGFVWPLILPIICLASPIVLIITILNRL